MPLALGDKAKAEELQKEIILAVGEENVPVGEEGSNLSSAKVGEDKVFVTDATLVVSSPLSTGSSPSSTGLSTASSSPHPDGDDFAPSPYSTSLLNNEVPEKGPFVKKENLRTLPTNVTYSTRQKKKK